MEENLDVHAKKPAVRAFRIIAGIVAVVLTIALFAIGISWLFSVVTILMSKTLFGYSVLFGLPPIELAILLTSALYIVFWPMALATRGFWSIAKGTNKYKIKRIIFGAIFFAAALAAIVVIALRLSQNLSVDYKDGYQRVLIKDGIVCISRTGACDN